MSRREDVVLWTCFDVCMRSFRATILGPDDADMHGRDIVLESVYVIT